MVYLITYDLNSSGQNYQLLFKTIESLGETIHPLQNLWFLNTASNASQIVETLRNEALDQNDHVFVTRVHSSDWQCWMPNSAVKWLQERL